MAKAKRGPRVHVRRAVPTTKMPTVAEAQGDIGRNALLLQDMYRAEMRAMTAERELGEIRRKLVALLSPDQIDAAKTCGVTPEFYALECIELYKAKFFPYLEAKARPLAVQSLPDLNNRGF